MKTLFTSFGKLLVTTILLASLSGCIVVDIKGAGVFREPVQYLQYPSVYTEIDIPAGVYTQRKDASVGDGSKISLGYLGSCGAGLELSGIMIPFFPFLRLNSCEKEGFYVYDKVGANTLGVTFQLLYNGVTYDPYFDTDEFYANGEKFRKDYVEFKISDFPAFKKAPDKTLIIHKRKPDGTIWTKELPFDWKIVTEVSGGL